jgi:hypothetical protein
MVAEGWIGVLPISAPSLVSSRCQQGLGALVEVAGGGDGAGVHPVGQVEQWCRGAS